jgi:hypothetical protein
VIAPGIAEPGFAVLSHGYGAGLLGMAETVWRMAPEPLIRATLREIDLLAPDLLVLDAGGQALAATSVAALSPPDWASWEAPDYAEQPQVATLLRAVEAASDRTPTAIGLPSPVTLAKQIAGRPGGPAEHEIEDWEELVDLASLALTDVADALTRTPGAHVLMHEQIAGVEPPRAADALESLQRMLAHRSRALLLWPHGARSEIEAWAEALASGPECTRVLSDDPDGHHNERTLTVVRPGDHYSVDRDVALVLDASSDPVEVQAWVRQRRSAMSRMERSNA